MASKKEKKDTEALDPKTAFKRLGDWLAQQMGKYTSSAQLSKVAPVLLDAGMAVTSVGAIALPIALTMATLAGTPDASALTAAMGSLGANFVSDWVLRKRDEARRWSEVDPTCAARPRRWPRPWPCN